MATDVWHVWPEPTQRPARQQPPASHVEPAQQTSPGLPQTTQLVPWQIEPGSQLGLVRQQPSPGPPQVRHVPGGVVMDGVEQRVIGALHTLPQQI